VELVERGLIQLLIIYIKKFLNRSEPAALFL